MAEETLPEIYNLESVEQMRAIADELRQRIVAELAAEPHTVTQVADMLGIAPAKVHYHMRELERVGLVKLVATREKGGILEKYYQPVARSFLVPAELLQRTPPEQYIESAVAFLQDITRGFINAMSRIVQQPAEKDVLALRRSHLWITRDEFNEIMSALEEIEHRYRDRRGVEGEQEVSFVVLANKPGPAEREGPEINREEAPVKVTGAPRAHQEWGAGVFQFDRADLESALARGETLDIRLLGVCTFNDDVSPELAERAVSRVSVRGRLVASPEVRAVLARKGAPT